MIFIYSFRSWVEPALSITFILTLLEVLVLLYGTVVTSLALGQEIEANLLALGLLTIFLWFPEGKPNIPVRPPLFPL